MLHYYNITIRVVFRTYDETRFSSRRIEKINENYARITGGRRRARHHGKPTKTPVAAAFYTRLCATAAADKIEKNIIV